MDLDDSIGNIIEYDPGSCSDNSDKENEPVPTKAPKTTFEQFNRISIFIDAHNQELIDKPTFDSLWEDLSIELNDMGPPEHTASKWKRIWSVHKYNNKRKRLAQPDDNQEPKRFLQSDSTASNTVTAESANVPQSSVLDSNFALLISNVSDKMDTVIENQSKMITNQQCVIRELQFSNRILQEIAKRT